MRRFMDRMAEIISRYRYRTAFTDCRETLTDLELEQTGKWIMKCLYSQVK